MVLHALFKTELRKTVKQKEIYVTLSRKDKGEHFGNFNEKNIWKNRKFWSEVKSLLLNKIVSTEIITLLEHKNVVDNDK